MFPSVVSLCIYTSYQLLSSRLAVCARLVRPSNKRRRAQHTTQYTLHTYIHTYRRELHLLELGKMYIYKVEDLGDGDSGSASAAQGVSPQLYSLILF